MSISKKVREAYPDMTEEQEKSVLKNVVNYTRFYNRMCRKCKSTLLNKYKGVNMPRSEYCDNCLRIAKRLNI